MPWEWQQAHGGQRYVLLWAVPLVVSPKTRSPLYPGCWEGWGLREAVPNTVLSSARTQGPWVSAVQQD